MLFENLCQICQEKSAPYKCPKCQMKYCSLTCYRDPLHQKCSNKFDENEFIDAMNTEEVDHERQMTTNNFVRDRIDEILKRKLDEKQLHDEENDEQIDELFEHLLPTKDTDAYRDEMADAGYDEAEDPEAEERLESDEEPLPDLPDDIDETDGNINQLWSYLTVEEQREFKSMLNDGRISHLLNDYKPWKPWWLYKTSAPALITDLESTTASSSSPLSLPETIPTVEPNVVPLPSLTSVLPHVHVRFDLFEILFAYALINIRYRGDSSSYVYESGTEFLHIASRHLTHKSEIIDEDQDSMSVIDARISLIREHLQDNALPFRISEEFFVNLLADVGAIIHGPYPRKTPTNTYVLAALSDLKRFCKKIQEYKPPSEDVDKLEEPNTTTSQPAINVFHTDRIMKSKTCHPMKSNESKLCVRPSSKKSKTAGVLSAKRMKKPRIFNKKLVQSLSHKIDYFLSWTLTHGDRLVMLEFELQQIERDLRHQLTQYQNDRTRIEQNLKHIRLQQQTTKRIQEL